MNGRASSDLNVRCQAPSCFNTEDVDTVEIAPGERVALCRYCRERYDAREDTHLGRDALVGMVLELVERVEQLEGMIDHRGLEIAKVKRRVTALERGERRE